MTVRTLPRDPLGEGDQDTQLQIFVSATGKMTRDIQKHKITYKLLELEINDRHVKIVSNLTAARQISVELLSNLFEYRSPPPRGA